MAKTPMKEIPVKAGQLYKHYNGGEYFILGVGYHSVNGEHLVTYRNKVYDPTDHAWSRPYDMFVGYLEDGVTKRFTLVSDAAIPHMKKLAGLYS